MRIVLHAGSISRHRNMPKTKKMTKAALRAHCRRGGTRATAQKLKPRTWFDLEPHLCNSCSRMSLLWNTDETDRVQTHLDRENIMDALSINKFQLVYRENALLGSDGCGFFKFRKRAAPDFRKSIDHRLVAIIDRAVSARGGNTRPPLGLRCSHDETREQNPRHIILFGAARISHRGLASRMILSTTQYHSCRELAGIPLSSQRPSSPMGNSFLHRVG